jgi:NADH-quinone oxidoreductase subunit D
MRNPTSDYRSSRKHLNNFLLNFGPQHPAAHGILKISLCMSGEIVQRADLQFGLLHRGSEKLCEARSYSQVVPYMDRMDYVANLFQEHAAVASIESLEPAKTPSSAILALRLVLDELSRVLNHLLTMSAICLDLGAMGPIF